MSTWTTVGTNERRDVDAPRPTVGRASVAYNTIRSRHRDHGRKHRRLLRPPGRVRPGFTGRGVLRAGDPGSSATPCQRAGTHLPQRLHSRLVLHPRCLPRRWGEHALISGGQSSPSASAWPWRPLAVMPFLSLWQRRASVENWVRLPLGGWHPNPALHPTYHAVLLGRARPRRRPRLVLAGRPVAALIIAAVAARELGELAGDDCCTQQPHHATGGDGRASRRDPHCAEGRLLHPQRHRTRRRVPQGRRAEPDRATDRSPPQALPVPYLPWS